MALPPGFGTACSAKIDPETGFLEGLDKLNISQERKKRLTKATMKRGIEWWNLSPAKQVHNTSSSTDIGREVVQGMLKCVGMRRGMDTILVLPDHADGTPWLVCPRDGIPAHHIEYHELSQVALKSYSDDLMNAHFKNLAVAVAASGPVESSMVVPYGGEVQSFEEGDGEGDSDGGHLNNGLLRILTIASMCLLSFMALQHSDEVAQQPDEVALADLQYCGEVGSTNARKLTKDRAHDRLHDAKTKLLRLGSAHSDALLHGTGDFGLCYLQLLALGFDPFDVIPVERKATLSRVLQRSPVWTHVLDLCVEQANKGERVLVMVSTPWAQL